MSHPSLVDTQPSVFWLDDPARPDPLASLSGGLEADLVVVGGGYSGLWTALRSIERYPGSSVVVLDGGRCGDQASGRNGGFVSASLTHGFGNGIARWPEELGELDRLGVENLADIGATISRYGIDCGWETTGELDVALAPHQLEELSEVAEAMTEHGHQVELLDAPSTRALVNSPAYVGGLLDRTGTALVEPARLAWGRLGAAASLPRARRTHLRGLARHPARRRGGGGRRPHRPRVRARAAGRAGHQRVPAAAASAQADDGAGL
ncbi:putative gamma-glutamylputrescine oxidoreductase (fragment) [metagenome]|uniref:Putative gamma-glutamylputrescine oxidoreductase n=1 Tax=metagenome TaxID=256318 RepID=A0A2P2CCP6_9ZZZZ